MPRNSDPDSIRILISTDNHVGFEERDPIRKDDSWKTFDEIMNLARTEDVDMVLLGGDLFHDNKPSRKSMYQVMRSLRQNCLGMKPCELEFLSDAAEIFEGAFGHVNYEDPDINISIPVFSIHGNHDDPSGDGHFCTLDLLQVAGFVNYFGRVPEADNLKVKPVMLQKGATKLALFGLSNVRDERMFRTFRDHKVTFFRPGQQAGDFFNLMVVHQNHHAHTATSYLPENFLPDWLNLVVWGHEHECLIDPQKNPETGFHVMQPGSSVATSLVPGEVVPKQVAILTVTGKDFSVQKFPLKTVRPFVTREIVLANEKKFKDLAKKRDNRAELTKRLMVVIEEMIDQANAEYMSLHENSEPEDDPPLPLIRLKVEYTAPEGGNFDCENPQRFSNRFAGKVANVNDVVYFHRKKTGTAGQTKSLFSLPEDDIEQGADFNAIKVEALVQEYLAAQSLKILPQGEFGDAVNEFVNKDDKHAMDTFVSGSLANQLKDLLELGAEDEDLDTAMETIRTERERQFQAGLIKNRHKRQYKPKPDDWDSDMEGHWENNPAALITEPVAEASAQTRTRPQTSRQGARSGTQRQDEDMSMDDFDELQPVAKPTTAKRATASRSKATTSRQTAAAKKAPAKRAGGRKKGPFEDSESDEDALMVDDIEDDEDEPPPPPTRRTRAAPARSAGRMKQTTLQLSQPTRQRAAPKAKRKAKATPEVVELSADEISDDDDFEPAPTTRSRRR